MTHAHAGGGGQPQQWSIYGYGEAHGVTITSTVFVWLPSLPVSGSFVNPLEYSDYFFVATSIQVIQAVHYCKKITNSLLLPQNKIKSLKHFHCFGFSPAAQQVAAFNLEISDYNSLIRPYKCCLKGLYGLWSHSYVGMCFEKKKPMHFHRIFYVQFYSLQVH